MLISGILVETKSLFESTKTLDKDGTFFRGDCLIIFSLIQVQNEPSQQDRVDETRAKILFGIKMASHLSSFRSRYRLLKEMTAVLTFDSDILPEGSRKCPSMPYLVLFMSADGFANPWLLTASGLLSTLDLTNHVSDPNI